jgi:hypothetical protein
MSRDCWLCRKLLFAERRRKLFVPCCSICYGLALLAVLYYLLTTEISISLQMRSRHKVILDCSSNRFSKKKVWCHNYLMPLASKYLICANGLFFLALA